MLMKNRAKIALTIWAKFAHMPRICPNNFRFDDEISIHSALITNLGIEL
jgi:hypothetical protein